MVVCAGVTAILPERPSGSASESKTLGEIETVVAFSVLQLRVATRPAPIVLGAAVKLLTIVVPGGTTVTVSV